MHLVQSRTFFRFFFLVGCVVTPVIGCDKRPQNADDPSEQACRTRVEGGRVEVDAVVYRQVLEGMAARLIALMKSSNLSPDTLLNQLNLGGELVAKVRAESIAAASTTPERVAAFVRDNPEEATAISEEVMQDLAARLGELLRDRIREVESESPDDQDKLWGTDVDRALARAKVERRPAFLFFTAEWAGACIRLERETFGDEAVSQTLRENFIPIRIDGTNDEDPKVQELLVRFRVTGLPTMLLLSPDGTVVDRLVDFTGPGEMLDRLRSHL